MNEMPDSLLAADEPVPVTVYNENGRSPFLIVADHAGNSIPRALGRLGVPESECERHIAWDIGIGAVCRIIGTRSMPRWFSRTIRASSSTATARRVQKHRFRTPASSPRYRETSA